MFVGIDSYLYSSAHNADAEFDDLKGAVADAGTFKRALEAAYRLDLDRPDAGQCRSANAISITLTNQCATRIAILEAFAAQIGAAAVGDTVLFYFAGHGSRLADDQVFDQASGYNSTLLPVDARKPGATQSTEILDREIRVLIDIASARGVNVVTVFDACNSGTGARGEIGEGRSRGVDPVAARPPVPFRARLAASGPGGGYRVHFGAARDDEEAREVGRGDSFNGVFTTAFAQALVARPDATFGDIATAVRLKVEQGGHKNQHPQAEGALRARLGGGGAGVALFEASAAGGDVEMTAGRLLGMTAGSRFALFASESDAVADGSLPLALGTIASFDDARSVLRLDAPAVPALPARLVAREVEHAWTGAARLRVAINEGVAPAESRLVAAVRALPFVEIAGQGEPALLKLLRRGDAEQAPVLVFARDGTGLTRLGEVVRPGFEEALRQALLAVYNAERLLALPSRPLAEAGVQLCLSHRLDHPVAQCPEPDDRQRRLVIDRPLAMTITNAGDIARHVAVLVIDDRYGITQLVPAHQGRDPPMEPMASQRTPAFKLDTTGLYRFVVIASDAPMATAALEQPAVRRSFDGACDREVEDPGLCDRVALGGRDGAAASPGAWTISIEDALVEREVGR